MMDYEKLGSFYLGRRYDLDAKRTTDEPLLYDSKDLTTHAVCVGMTGSGKTGLCVSLLEEAAIDGIPALVIDPKGDLGNLLLTFPELSAQQFQPWVNPDEARRADKTVEAYAAEQAQLWQKGLASWEQDGERIRRLRQAADFAIYTPGSEAGLPISILDSFAAPPAEVRGDADLMRDRVTGTTTSLLGLLGIEADPIRSREHILIATIMDRSWKEGRDLDLAALIRTIQSPPIERIGVLDLESFYPAKDRFDLAMRLNGLLAAPGFQGWLTGHPLDVQGLLYTTQGKPRVSIFSIAHLSDSERMFMVSLLLNQVVAWMRSRPGTTTLRALVYMDEIFGFVPPSAEPPSKKPLLTLLKQARAHGLGVVLATQNPVDLDYKGLSNTGTWFLGRLQTERDKMRVLAGLEGMSGAGGAFDKGATERLLAGLGKRVFLMHNVHDDGPVVFHTRWAMSYLRGPLTREHINRLMRDHRDEEPQAASPSPAVPSVAAAPVVEVSASRPVLSPGVPETFLPARDDGGDGELIYEPRLIGLGRVQFVDRKTKKLKHVDEVALLLPLGAESSDVDWREAVEATVCQEDLERDPGHAARFGSLPPVAANAKSYTAWRKQLSDTLYRTRNLELHQSPSLGLISEPGESERDFRVRLGDLAREKRDRLADKLRKKYASRLARLEERIRKAQHAVGRETQQASGQKLQTAISFGATVLSAFLGRKKLSYGTLGRATTAMRGMGRTAKERSDVQRAKENVAALEEQLGRLNQELETELDQLEDRLDPLTEELATTALRPRRSDVEIRLVALAWAPRRRGSDGSLTDLWP
jgi:hypothetical protein